MSSSFKQVGSFWSSSKISEYTKVGKGSHSKTSIISKLCQVARSQKYLEQYVMCQLILLKLLVSYCSADSNGPDYVKLKQKLEYHGHFLFKPARPMFLGRLLRFLKENNPLYCKILVKTENLLLHLSLLIVFDNSWKQNRGGGFCSK